ncbi:MAG: DMT family transporter, partial [Bdellovibrionota bacterium]
SAFSVVASFVLFGHQFVAPNGDEFVTLLMAGLFGTVAQLLMTHAYKHQEASTVSPYSYSAILFSAMFGAVFWNEMPDRWTFLGGIVMVVAGVRILKAKKSSDGFSGKEVVV